jgi:nitrous oxidase accessory protein NosD
MIVQAIPVAPVKGAIEKCVANHEYRKHMNLVLALPEIAEVGSYQWLTMPNSSYISTPGNPRLPIKSIVMKLPLNSKVTETVIQVQNVSLEGTYFVLPASVPVIVGSNQSPSNVEPNPLVYGKDALYPEDWFVHRCCNGIDPETGVRVQFLIFYFYPLRYSPQKGKVTFAQNTSFEVSYEQAEQQNLQGTLKNLIITSTLLEPQATRFAQWKNSTGILTRVVNTSLIYSNYVGVDNPEKIRNCIKDFVLEYGLMYVTIFGDADQVPVRYAYVPDGEDTYTPTDLYYADLDGTWDDNGDGLFADQRYDAVDGIPDVYVGRITVSTVQYATSTVSKIMNYTNQNMTVEWTKRVILAAGTPDGGDGATGTGNTVLNNCISNIIANKEALKLYEIFGNCTTALMLSDVNQGASFVNFAGHGDPGDYTGAAGWLLFWIFDHLTFECFHVSLVQSLTNGLKLPVVTAMSCSTARFDDHECVGEWWLMNPNGGGIAYFGATRIAYCWNDDSAPYGFMGEMDRRIYESFYEGYTNLGRLWGAPVTRYVQYHIPNYHTAWVYDVKTLMEFIMFGDPTLRIYNGPETLEVPDEYASIQGAVNSAYDGDTIQVASGTYYEHLVVNKTVSLVGENQQNTIIDGSGAGNVIQVTADNVTINGFTVRNGSTGLSLSSAKNCGISGNTITGGIYTEMASGGRISGNDITGGISLYYGSGGFSISENNITGGIDSYYGGGNISENTITGDVVLNYGGGNIIGNTITEGQIYLQRATATISGNTLIECSIGLGPVGICTIFHNNFINFSGFYHWMGGGGKFWEDDYPSGGNYWSDYVGTDLFWGSYQNKTGSDGIGDTPYIIDDYNQDNYPLISPYEYWSNPIQGDINKDMKVDNEDLDQIATAYGSTSGKSNWNPNCDINTDNIVSVLDLLAHGKNFGQTSP